MTTKRVSSSTPFEQNDESWKRVFRMSDAVKNPATSSGPQLKDIDEPEGVHCNCN